MQKVRNPTATGDRYRRRVIINTFTESREAVVDINIILPGSHLPVLIMGVNLLIVDQEMDDVLLGRRLLRELNFDLVQHLTKIINEVNNKHVEEFGKVSRKLAETYRGISCRSADDDPITFTEGIATGFGKDSSVEITNGFKRMEADAKLNGISDRGDEILTRILENNRDIFRIKLGGYPPEKVNHFQIKMKTGARPYRSPQRIYAHIHSSSITKTIRELEKIGELYPNRSSS